MEPFFTSKTLGSGTGLGLSQVYGVARQSGGTVRIESKLGQGTKIWVYFPRAKSVAAPRAIARTEPPQSGRQGSVLVVDDDPDVRRYVSTALAEFGHTVTEAANARDALDILGRGDRSTSRSSTICRKPMARSWSKRFSCAIRRPGTSCS